MEVIHSGRKTGKTSHLIHLCHEAEKNGEVAYMVCHNQAEAYRIAQKAKELGYESFPFPITYDEFLSPSHSPFIRKFFIDNTEKLLQRLARNIEVAAISINKDDDG